MTRAGAFSLLLLVASCSACVARHNDPPPASGAAAADDSGPRQSVTIDHLYPAGDSVGRAPAEFRWTAVTGAESYTIGVYNEIGLLIWRQDDIAGTSLKRPDQLTLEPGGYHWIVYAYQGGRVVGESGRSAFAVRTDVP